ncbi:hypothetical protein EEL32_06690 [Brevibacillus laterosporus]|nr:hypothetical protein [Brevibacillus laterosporus]TPG89210.1 hypothetical protein EEL32_06690 [Brevibacillus laterosporus]
MTDLVFPPDTNHHNTIFGGKVMAYVDKIACIALDEKGKPTLVPPIIPETEEEQRQYEQAQKRYEDRKKRRKEKESQLV